MMDRESGRREVTKGETEREEADRRDGFSGVVGVRRWCNDEITGTLEPSSRPSCAQKKKKKSGSEIGVEEGRCQCSSGRRRRRRSGLERACSASPALPRREGLDGSRLTADLLNMLWITARRLHTLWEAAGGGGGGGAYHHEH